MKKLIKIGLLLTLVTSLLVGCAQGKGNNSNPDPIPEKPGVEASIKKAVVLDMGTLDTMDALGIEIELALPIDSLPAYLDKYEDQVNIGGLKELDLEAIYEFEPDIIFISGRQESYMEELTKIAETILIEIDASTYMEDFTRNVKNIAEIFEKSDEADQMISEIQDRVDSVHQEASSIEEKGLIVLTNDGSLSVYGLGSRFGIIHDVLGVKTADDSIASSTHGQEANYEYISKTNPDILFVVDRTVVVGGSNLAGKTLDNDLVNSTNAVKNDKVILLDPDVWYLSGGGISSVNKMIDDIEAAIK